MSITAWKIEQVLKDSVGFWISVSNEKRLGLGLSPVMNHASYLKTWLHRRFIFLLFAAYVLAALMPSPGLWIKGLEWGELPGSGGNVSTSLLMLGVLLFNAGFSVNREHIQALRRRPALSVIGVFGKGILAAFWVSMLLLATSLEVNMLWISMLAGFAIVSLMPVATSSTAWAQQTNSNLALSLGLLLLSTALMPLIVPFMGWMMQQLPSSLNPTVSLESTKSLSLGFIVIWILLPVVLGVLFQMVLSNPWITRMKPWVRWINAINLLSLNYMHGASFLPQRLHPFQPLLMICLLAGVAICCMLAFAVGGCLGKLFRVEAPERMAFMFGTGMNNNGMALVLASQFLGESGWIGLTIALCTFGQHLVAGAVQILFGNVSSMTEPGMTILGEQKVASTRHTSPAEKTSKNSSATLLPNETKTS